MDRTPVLRELADRTYVSVQLYPDDLPRLLTSGVRWIVNHRPDGEEPGQPTAEALALAAEACGIEMVHAPFTGYPPPAVISATAEALAKASPDGSVLLFCRSGLRSTLAWALAERRRGTDPESLRSAAMAAGYDLRGASL